MRISTTAAAAALGLSLVAAPVHHAQATTAERSAPPAVSADRYKCLIWVKTTANYTGHTAGYSWAWNKLVRRGDTGNRVKEIQCLLDFWADVYNEADFEPGPLDGAFGKKTKEAVLAFQSFHGLPVDGIVGPATWRSLR
jgi:murein L,D-transpeptidase YcbB/YkuD